MQRSGKERIAHSREDDARTSQAQTMDLMFKEVLNYAMGVRSSPDGCSHAVAREAAPTSSADVESIGDIARGIGATSVYP